MFVLLFIFYCLCLSLDSHYTKSISFQYQKTFKFCRSRAKTLQVVTGGNHTYLLYFSSFLYVFALVLRLRPSSAVWTLLAERSVVIFLSILSVFIIFHLVFIQKRTMNIREVGSVAILMACIGLGIPQRVAIASFITLPLSNEENWLEVQFSIR